MGPPDGRVNKFQEESSRDQIPVLMMTLSSRRRPDSDTITHILFKRRLSQSLVTLDFTIPLLPDGLVNKLVDKNSRDQTQALMMILFSGEDQPKLLPMRPRRCTTMRDTESPYPFNI